MEKIKNIKLPNGEVYELGGSGGGGLPMLTSIWTDHLLNDASYLRADTFSWHSADIYITGYNIIEAEYDNENCIEETENGVTYRRSPNGFKIADASQHDNVLSAYNSTGIAWFYIIDKANRRFKLPRTKYGFTGVRDGVGLNVEAGLPNIDHTHTRGTMNITGSLRDAIDQGGLGWVGTGAFQGTFTDKGNYPDASGKGTYNDSFSFDASRSWTGETSTNSDVDDIYGNSDTVQPPGTQMYLYFYVGDYERPKAEINLGVLTELANGLDLNTIISEIDTASNTGISSIQSLTTSGIEALENKIDTGVSDIETITESGKAELQKIIVDKVPVATVDNVGLVKPDGTTITIADGVISAVAQSSSEFTFSKGTNSWLKHSSGLMIQAGSISYSKNASNVTVTFPKAFTTRCCGITVTGNMFSVMGDCLVASLSTTSATLGPAASTVDGILYWIAFGY